MVHVLIIKGVPSLILHPLQTLSVPPTIDKKDVLLHCAFIICSVVVKWDLDSFEKGYVTLLVKSRTIGACACSSMHMCRTVYIVYV